jgi:hypothetical protein
VNCDYKKIKSKVWKSEVMSYCASSIAASSLKNKYSNVKIYFKNTGIFAEYAVFIEFKTLADEAEFILRETR